MSQNSTQGFRLSPQQRNIWSLQQDSGSQTSQVVSTIAIKGDLRPDTLERALDEVVGRHEILRTTFQRPPGIKIPFQVVSQESEVSWQFSDLSSLDEEARLSKLEVCFAAERGKPFDFEKGPILRASLFKLSSEDHILLISLPALCADPKTVANLIDEIGNAYGLSHGGVKVANEPMQYADFAEWQNELLEGSDEEAEKGKSYWQELASASRSPLALPLEKPSTNKHAFRTKALALGLDSTSVAKLELLAREHETSIQVVLFACWQALIWRLTNQSDFVIFNLSHGRKLEDLQSAMGLYANYLPIACHTEDISFAEHLQGTRDTLSKAEEWADYLDPNNFSEAIRDAVAFDFTEQLLAIETDGLRFSLARQEFCLSPFKLKLSYVRSADSIRGELFYDSQRFEPETVERFAEYFTRFVEQTSAGAPFETSQPAKRRLQTEILAEPTIGTIEILGEAEVRRLLVDFNHTASEFSITKCVHESFAEQAARTPEATALVCGDQEVTYGELNARANQLAHLLRHRDVTADTCVGLCMERSVEIIVALLGILKAGGAYVPLNPEHPVARLKLQLEESNASILITNGSALAESLKFDGTVVDFERDRTLLLSGPKTNPPSVTTTENLVYVIYTSGSTGVPKGVAVKHQGLGNYVQFILRRLEVNEPLHFGTVSTITADLGNTCIFPALVSGGCVHLISYDTSMEGDLFAAYLAKHPIDVLKIVPSHLSALLASKRKGVILPRKYLILGGEALSWNLVERISQEQGSCKVINHYGPTETTVGSLTFNIDRDASYNSNTVPIGQPIANTQVYILDRHLNPTPTGVAGELYIGGAGVAAGYLNQPEETARRFLCDPYSRQPSMRLYRTGDLARYLADGNVEFLGRIDHQLKVRGFRVELGEIEAVLAMHHEVRQAVVIAEAGTSGSERLVAYVVASGIKPPTNEELRNFLSQHVPDYMIPSTFVFLKAMPLTPNGKIDRAALPAPDEARPDMQRLFVAPRTSLEKELADIWAEFLKLNEVGVHDNFFELGGHSLLATQVVSRMRKALNCELPLRSLFESPTIAQLAEQIGSNATDAERLVAEIEKLSDEEVEALLKAEQL